VRTRANRRTFVDVRPNQRGVIDSQELQALEDQLVELADDRAAGNIFIQLQDLEAMTAGFMNVLAPIRPRLDCQQRRLTLYNLQPQCADPLQGSDERRTAAHPFLATDHIAGWLLAARSDWVTFKAVS
jgi:anti-anti-sigma regulatory factor